MTSSIIATLVWLILDNQQALAIDVVYAKAAEEATVRNQVSKAAIESTPVLDVALAVDASYSMRGFHAAMPIFLSDLSRAVGLKGESGNAVRLPKYKLGSQVTPVATSMFERQLADERFYSEKRADLAGMFRDPVLATASMRILVTDGQPTPEGTDRNPCTYEGAIEIGSLVAQLETILAAGGGLWLLVERLPFDGTFFANCAVPTIDQKELLDRRRSNGCHSGSKTAECTYVYKGDRTLIVLVTAEASALDVAQEVVERFLKRRPMAKAVRFHDRSVGTTRDYSPTVEVYGADGRSTGNIIEKPASGFVANVVCPAEQALRERAFSVCIRGTDGNSSKSAQEIPLIRHESRPLMSPDLGKVVFEIPSQQSFHATLLKSLQASRYDVCGDAWRDYEQRVPDEAPTKAGCSAEVGGWARSFVGLCGCLRNSAKGTVEQSFEIREYGNVDTGAIDQALGKYSVESDDWIDHPEQIYGLSHLWKRLARGASQRLPDPLTRPSLQSTHVAIEIKEP